MKTQTEALKLTLEALEDWNSPLDPQPDEDIITALRQAIEQAQKQEPVAKVADLSPYRRRTVGLPDETPLYTSSPRQPEQMVAKFDARHDADRLKVVARGMSYNDAGEAVLKHTLMEIAMRLETGGYTPQRQPEQEAIGEVVTAGVIRWKDKYPSLGTKLYTSPPQRPPLPVLVIASLCKKEGGDAWWWADIHAFARAIEAAHGITGEPK